MKIIGLFCTVLTLIAGCSKPGTQVGDWYERIEDRKRVRITGVGTGRELLDQYYRHKHFSLELTDTTFKEGHTFAVVMSMVEFPDSSANLMLPCVRWGEIETQTREYMGMPSALSVTRFQIIPLAKFELDYQKVK